MSEIYTYADPVYQTPAADFRAQSVLFIRKDGYQSAYRLMSSFSIKTTNNFTHVQGAYPVPQAFTTGQYGPAEGSFEMVHAAWAHFFQMFLYYRLSDVMFDMQIFTNENNLVYTEFVRGVRISDIDKSTSEGGEPIKVTANFKALQYRPDDVPMVASVAELLNLSVNYNGQNLLSPWT